MNEDYCSKCGRSRSEFTGYMSYGSGLMYCLDCVNGDMKHRTKDYINGQIDAANKLTEKIKELVKGYVGLQHNYAHEMGDKIEHVKRDYLLSCMSEHIAKSSS